MTFSGVASNFAGVPLAFAFLATLGRTRPGDRAAARVFGINLYAPGFNLLSFWGLTLTYLYFQIPLMVLIITPALDGLKREWREAAEILGATPLAVLADGGAADAVADAARHAALLFANAFGAVATAYALTGSLAQHRRRSCSTRRSAATCCTTRNLGYALALRHDRHHRRVATASTSGCASAASGGCEMKRRVWAWLAFASACSISSCR